MPDNTNDTMQDVQDLADQYDQHPSLKGIYRWNLTEGATWADLPLELNRLVPKMADFTLHHSFETPARREGGVGDVDLNPDDSIKPGNMADDVADRGLPMVRRRRYSMKHGLAAGKPLVVLMTTPA